MDTTVFGTHNFNTYYNTCYDSFAPFQAGIPTHIDITHKNVDVSILNKSWLNIEFEVGWQRTGANAISSDEKIFIGWKNAAECIRRIEVLNGDRDSGYLQIDNDMEAFLHHTRYTTAEEKRHNPISHTTYKDIADNTWVAGTFLDSNSTGAADGHGTITIPITLPLTDIPALRYFKEFPACFGPLTLKLWFDPSGMVFAQYYDPQPVEETPAEDEGDEDTSATSPTPTEPGEGASGDPSAGTGGEAETPPETPTPTEPETFDARYFKQNGIPGIYTYGEDTFTITSMTIKSLVCEVQGYTITQEGKQKLAEEFGPETPYIIPCLHTQFRTYDGHIEHGNFNIEFPMAVHNVKDIHLEFPTHSSQRTCFQNPMLKGVQIKAHNVQYPKLPIRTDSARFVRLQINGYEPDYDYARSLETRNKSDGTIIENKDLEWDNTSFILTIPMERENEPNAFDGYETGDENVNFNLVGQVIYNNEANRVYGSTDNEPPPFIWFTSKAFWTADTQNGLVFHDKEVPNY